MHVLHDDTTDLEDELRALLRRRAGALHPEPPAWRDLVSRPDHARGVIVPLPTEPAADRRPTVRRRHLRPALTAAAVAAVLLAAGLAVNETRSGPTDAEEPIALQVAAPTDAAFDARTAPTVWASGLGDPLEATSAYLQAAGIAPQASAGAQATADGGLDLVVVENDGEVAVVEWSLAGEASGTVQLRHEAITDGVSDAASEGVATAQSTAGSAWSVVGATATQIVLTDVSYDGERLSFAVSTAPGAAGPLAVSVWSDGGQVLVEGDVTPPSDAVSAGAEAAGQPGAVPQLVELDERADGRLELSAAVDPATGAIVSLRSLVDGRPTSITEVAVGPSGAAATNRADLAWPGDLAGDAEARANAAATGEGNDGRADAHAGGDGATSDAGVTTSSPAEAIDGAREAAEDILDGVEAPLPGGEVTPPSVTTTVPELPAAPVPQDRAGRLGDRLP